jgi:stress-induced morphogen
MWPRRTNGNLWLGECGGLANKTAMQAPARAERIETLLRAAFAPTLLRIADDSARHAGHAGATAAGETHYSVLLVSAAFEGQGRVARHRAVNAVLREEFASGLHALALVLRTPAEQAAGPRIGA